jgi:DNA-binding NarL/FixJ family response regulator
MVTPEQFLFVVQDLKESIGWVSKESGHSPPREFVELLSSYLAAQHFAFIHKEARLLHTMDHMIGSLTNRQQEIIKLVLLAMTNKAIAETLMVSEATVHHEITKILKAFSVENRGELIDYVAHEREIQKASPPPA